MVNASRAPPFLDDPPVPFRSLFFLTTRRPPTSTLFPYTTLFRSHVGPAVVSIVAIEPLDLRPDRRFGSRELSPDGRHPNQRQHRVNRRTSDRSHRSVYREAAVARYPVLRGKPRACDRSARVNSRLGMCP